MVVVYLLVAMLGAAATLFALQNATPTEVAFLHWHSASIPLSLLILVAALAGILLAALSGVAQQLRMHLKIRALERRLAELSDGPGPPWARRDPAPPPMDQPLPRT